MRKSCLLLFLVFLLLLSCALFTSCATKPKTEYITVTETEIQTITETEYVPVYVDLNDTIKTVIDQRPDNSQYKILTGKNLKDSWGLMYNSWTYQCVWQAWQAYAELLEDTLYICRDKCADPATLIAPEAAAEPAQTEVAEPTTEGETTTTQTYEIPVIHIS